MDHKVIWTARALADLESIVGFIAQRDREAARKIGYSIIEHVRILEDFPLIGPVWQQAEDLAIHQIVCGSYRIFYRAKLETHCVEIVHIRHTARRPFNP